MTRIDAMKPSLLTLIPITGLLLLCSCGSGDGGRHAAPLPQAFPRIGMPGPEYTVADTLMHPLTVNASALLTAVRRDGGEWIDIAYPQFGQGRVYLTINNVAPGREEEMLANRTERMALNTGGMPGELTELTSRGGWHCSMLLTRGSVTTPVQVLASGPGMMLSGALHLSVPQTTPPDSVSPVVDAVARDMMEMLKSL